MFECKICNTNFKNIKQLLIHLKIHNIKYQDYLKIYIWKSINYYGITITPGICPICNNSVILNYNNLRIFCSNKCQGIFSKTSKEYKTNIKSKIIETSIKKYGVDNVAQLELKKDLSKQTKLKKYGDANYNNRIQAKQTKLKKYGDSNYNNRDLAKQTCVDLYGVENPFQSNLIKKLSKQTKLKKYGDANYINIEKMKKTNLKKYGAEYYSQSNDFQNKKDLIIKKMEKTCIEKYGVKAPILNENFLKKSKQTCIERYGVDNYTKSDFYLEKIPEFQDLAKQTCIDLYGAPYYQQSETYKETLPKILNKIKETNLKKYGADFYSQSETYQKALPEIQKKIYRIKKKNNSFNTSAPEKKLLKILQNKFGDFDIEYQYRSPQYPFVCDFYIKSLDLYIELQGSWTHGSEPYNPENPEHIKKLNDWILKAKKSQFYRNAIDVWTVRDPLKRLTAKNNGIKLIEVFDSENFSEIEFLIN